MCCLTAHTLRHCYEMVGVLFIINTRKWARFYMLQGGDDRIGKKKLGKKITIYHPILTLNHILTALSAAPLIMGYK